MGLTPQKKTYTVSSAKWEEQSQFSDEVTLPLTKPS